MGAPKEGRSREILYDQAAEVSGRYRASDPEYVSEELTSAAPAAGWSPSGRAARLVGQRKPSENKHLRGQVLVCRIRHSKLPRPAR
jgi:hypothetical protein